MAELCDVNGNPVREGVYRAEGGIDDGDFLFVGGKMGEGLKVFAYRGTKETDLIPLSEYDSCLIPLNKQEIEELKSKIKGFDRMLKKAGLEQLAQTKEVPVNFIMRGGYCEKLKLRKLR